MASYLLVKEWPSSPVVQLEAECAVSKGSVLEFGLICALCDNKHKGQSQSAADVLQGQLSLVPQKRD
jgi:hypothetical protein